MLSYCKASTLTYIILMSNKERYRISKEGKKKTSKMKN